MITQPELIQRILVKDAHLFVNRPEFITGNDVLDSMLFVARGSQWKRIRMVVTPTLTGHKLRRMRKLVDCCVDSAVDRLQTIAAKCSAMDLKHFWGLYTVDNISKCFFATDLDLNDKQKSTEVGQRDEKSGFLHHMKAMVDVPVAAMLLYMHLPKKIQQWLGLAFFPKKSINYFQQLLRFIVRRRTVSADSYDNDFLQYLIERSELSSKNEPTESAELDLQKESNPIDLEPDMDGDSFTPNCDSSIKDVSQLLHRNVRLTEDEVLGQCLIFLIGGYDTTSTLLAWLSYRLALGPHMQEKLHRELQECRRQKNLGPNDLLPFECLESLEYLNALIYETLRFYPPFTMIERRASQDYTLPELNLIVPKGMEVGIPLYTMHHMHRHFPLPELFLPERFLSDQYLENHQFEHGDIDRRLMPRSALENGMNGAFGVDAWADHSSDEPIKQPGRFDASMTSMETVEHQSTIDLVQSLHLNRVKPYTFLPFGAGPRTCVGKRFALLDARAVLAQLIPRFRLEPCAQTRFPPRFKTSLSFTHSNDLIIAVKSRN